MWAAMGNSTNKEKKECTGEFRRIQDVENLKKGKKGPPSERKFLITLSRDERDVKADRGWRDAAAVTRQKGQIFEAATSPRVMVAN